MLKKLLLIAALAALSTSLALADTGPALAPCLRENSTLCPVLGATFGFEEDSDRARFDSVGGAIAVEPDGYNVARRAGKVGSYAADFAGSDNSYLRLPGITSLGPGFWTVTAWVYPDTAGSAGQKQTLLANDFKNQTGTHVYLENVSGSLYLKASVTTAELDTTITATSGTALSVGAWNFVMFGASPFPAINGQAVVFAQANGGTKGTSALTYFPFGVNTETYLGARASQAAGSRTPFDGGLDQLNVFSAALNPLQAQNLHNGGTGISYPFTDPQLPFTVNLYPSALSASGSDAGMSGAYTDIQTANMNLAAQTGSVRWTYSGAILATGYMDVALDDPPTGATFNYVKVYVRGGPAQGNGSAANVIPTMPPSGAVYPRVTVNGTTYGGGGGDISDYYNINTGGCSGTCGGTVASYQWDTNPATGLAWTYNDIVSLVAGVSINQRVDRAGGYVASINVDQVYVEISGQYGW
jgi:hypothetical protein